MSLETPSHPTAAPAAAPASSVQPFTVVLFGASGDLAHRMVVPALFRLWRRGLLSPQFKLIGYARTHMDDEAFREGMKKAVLAKPLDGDKAAWPDFARSLSYVAGAYDGDEAGYEALSKLFAGNDEANKRRLFYLALPPQTFAPVVHHLAKRHLVGHHVPKHDGGWARVIVEKPFGHDLASARALTKALEHDVAEQTLYRIDHFLGKEAAQNLFTFRFGNGLFEPIWNRNYIDHVEVTAAETLGVEGRGGYYESAGALRDMVQNHLLQLMALVALEPPATWTSDAVRNEKVKVLQAIKPYAPDEIDRYVVRGQYAGGKIGDQAVPAYRAEPDVAKGSSTETYVALRLQIDNWRWAGVPFYLRSGKRLAGRKTEIAIQFKPAPHTPFPVPVDAGACNTLVVQFSPGEGLSLNIAGKQPGRGMNVTPVDLTYCSANAADGTPPPSAYENLLLDALVGDSTFFARADEVDASWQVINPILEHWAGLPGDLPAYAAGSEGPSAAAALLARDGRIWRAI